MKKKLNTKYITVTCPHCQKKTKGAGFRMVRAYSMAKFAGIGTKKIAYLLGCTDRYIRELIGDFPHLCEHCHERLVPSERDWEIIRLRLKGATQKQLADIFGLSVYKIRKIRNRWLNNMCIADEEFIWSRRRDYPEGWFKTSEHPEGVARAWYGKDGHSWDGEDDW